ncbi:MAG: hypothetical protein H3C27_15015 [Opitutaceae bacterium]|nr:hypothetical protein [Opitutaceae bacterium]
MSSKAHVYVVVPAFREATYFSAFVRSWEQVNDEYYRVVVVLVNGCPGDELSKKISSYDGPLDVVEILGSPDLYWCGLVSLGLQFVVRNSTPNDIVILANIDIKFDGNPLSAIFKRILSGDSIQATVLVADSAGVLLSAGVLVRSWILSINRHLMLGRSMHETTDEWIEATYLPTRLMVFPSVALKVAGLPNCDRLPHYCADYEFSNRLRKNGYRALVYLGFVVRNDEKNSGFSTFTANSGLRKRISMVFNIKSSFNLRSRFWFVILTYPRWAIVPGLISHFSKLFIELLMGGERLKRVRLRGNN